MKNGLIEFNLIKSPPLKQHDQRHNASCQNKAFSFVTDDFDTEKSSII